MTPPNEVASFECPECGHASIGTSGVGLQGYPLACIPDCSSGSRMQHLCMGRSHLLKPTNSAKPEHGLHLVIGFWRLGVLDSEAAVRAARELFPHTDLGQFVSITDGHIDPCFAGTKVRLDAALQAAIEGCSLQSMQAYWKFLRAEHLVAALVVAAQCWPHDQLPVGIRPMQWPPR